MTATGEGLTSDKYLFLRTSLNPPHKTINRLDTAKCHWQRSWQIRKWNLHKFGSGLSCCFLLHNKLLHTLHDHRWSWLLLLITLGWSSAICSALTCCWVIKKGTATIHNDRTTVRRLSPPKVGSLHIVTNHNRYQQPYCLIGPGLYKYSLRIQLAITWEKNRMNIPRTCPSSNNHHSIWVIQQQHTIDKQEDLQHYKIESCS